MLWYVPLEPYEQRYTAQLSAANDGWLERNWITHGVEYRRVEGRSYRKTIKHGSVLDAVGRSIWAMSQIEELLKLADNHKISSDDVIYFDDLWHPGLEALRYSFDLMNIRPRMYSYLWAQSFDQYDFTAKMRHWIRPFEIGNFELFDGVFVANSLLKAIIEDTLEDKLPIHVVGLPFDIQEVNSRMPMPAPARYNRVVFSSRWDGEKQPDEFLRIMDRVLPQEPGTQFVICTGASNLTSNSPTLIKMLEYYLDKYPNNLFVQQGLTKEAYYEILASSKVQVNTALQDWVSFTLLEASVAGCWPVYPNRRSFPETLRQKEMFLYNDLDQAAAMIVAALRSETIFRPEVIKQRAWIHERFDLTWARMLVHMGLIKKDFPSMSIHQMNPYQ